PLEVGWERLVGGEHVGEIGLAAGVLRRDFERVENRGLGRHIDKGHVGVPDRLAVPEISDRLAVLDHVGDYVYFRKFFEGRPAIRIWRGRVEFAKVFAECEKLRI